LRYEHNDRFVGSVVIIASPHSQSKVSDRNRKSISHQFCSCRKCSVIWGSFFFLWGL